jgi:hypothetical protein
MIYKGSRHNRGKARGRVAERHPALEQSRLPWCCGAVAFARMCFSPRPMRRICSRLGRWGSIRRGSRYTACSPNIWGPMLVLAAASLAAVMLGLSSLSCVGQGVEPPRAEWAR